MPTTFPLSSFQSIVHNRPLINIYWVKKLMKSPLVPISNLVCSTLSKCLGFYLLKAPISSLWVRKNKLGSYSPFCSTLSINIIIQKQNFKDTKRHKVFKDRSINGFLCHKEPSHRGPVFKIWALFYFFYSSMYKKKNKSLNLCSSQNLKTTLLKSYT